MHDPITTIQKILDRTFSHLLFYQEKHFVDRFGRCSPTVTGVDEAASRLKKAKIGNLGTSIELDDDFSDLYSFCDINLLKKHVKVACELAGFNTNTVYYINNLIFVEMNRSYFCEPTGVFRTTQGFSMGDNAAARSSEIILERV